MQVKGKMTSAKIFIDEFDFSKDVPAINQVKALCDIEVLKDSKIRIMPDMCPAIGTTIGSTFTFKDKLMPVLVSSDIGCGITVLKLDTKKIEFEKLDRVIREQLTERNKIESILSKSQDKIDLNNLYCKKYVDTDRCLNKLGDLGGGNHFLEVDKDENGYLYLTVHSGSRLLGQQIYDFYMNEGYKAINDKSYNRIFTYLEDDLLYYYLKDVEIARRFAYLNRETILNIIVRYMKLKTSDFKIDCPHNYVDIDNKIIRKGAISAQKDEDLIIPISASPIYGGIIIGIGKGNEDWNCSAPHGAGRLFSRGDSKDDFSFKTYKDEMKDVHSMSVTKASIDESPMVYKKREFILRNIGESVEVDKILTPVYNFKKIEK